MVCAMPAELTQALTAAAANVLNRGCMMIIPLMSLRGLNQGEPL